MILVLLGTQNNSFNRLLEEIERNIENDNIKEEVLVQAGCTKYKSKKMKIFDFVSREDSASRGVIPKIPEQKDKLPPKDQIKIPPRARDGQTFKTDNELPEREMLIKIMNQNKKIINQNKIIIEQLKRLGEKDD